jgi:hypothetical protein
MLSKAISTVVSSSSKLLLAAALGLLVTACTAKERDKAEVKTVAKAGAPETPKDVEKDPFETNPGNKNISTTASEAAKKVEFKSGDNELVLEINKVDIAQVEGSINVASELVLTNKTKKTTEVFSLVTNHSSSKPEHSSFRPFSQHKIVLSWKASCKKADCSDYLMDLEVSPLVAAKDKDGKEIKSDKKADANLRISSILGKASLAFVVVSNNQVLNNNPVTDQKIAEKPPMPVPEVPSQDKANDQPAPVPPDTAAPTPVGGTVNTPPAAPTPPAQTPATPAKPVGGPAAPAPVRPAPAKPAEPFVVKLKVSYAEAGEDLLIERLTKKLASEKSDNQKRLDYAAAQMIAKVETKASADAQNVLVRVVLTEDKKEHVHLLGAAIDGKQQGKLNSVQSSGRTKVKGHLMCLDEKANGCYVSLITLSLRMKAGIGKAYVVVRKSDVDLNWKLLKEDVSLVDGANEIVNVLENVTFRRTEGHNLIAALSESFEVVNGLVAARFTLVTSQDQVLSFHGPLMMPKGTTSGDTNVVFAKDIRSEQVLDIVNPGKIKKSLSESIKQARLIKVEGGRFLTLDLDLKSAERGKTQVLRLQFERLHPELRNVNISVD